MFKDENKIAYLLLSVYYVAMLAMAFLASGTGDDGDSIAHYLFSRYAFVHPENFIEHWAKPVFVLLSAPFAQFGFIGIKIFNVTVTTLAILFTYRIARQLKIRNSWFVIVALCFAPMYLRLTLSGLTEPLFALAITVAIFLALRKHFLASVIIVSFLPFIRSEGLIIIGVFAFYLIITRRYKLMPILATGHIVYSILGWFYYTDFLWVFNKMTYAVWNSSYGQGSPLTFVWGMVDFIGLPLAFLLVVGTIALMSSEWAVFKFKRLKIFSSEEVLLVYASFFAIWLSHTIFWTFGLFNSLGLVRVLIAVAPCAAIICLHGFNLILNVNFITSNPAMRLVASISLTVCVIVTPFIQLDYKCSFELNGNQQSLQDAGKKYGKQLEGYTIYASSPYSLIPFNCDPFDTRRNRRLKEIHLEKQFPEKSAIVWDGFYAPNEDKVALANLMEDERFELLDIFEAQDCMGNTSKSAVFLIKTGAETKWMVKDTIYSIDFESEPVNEKITTPAFSGKYSCRIDQDYPFSPGLQTKVIDLGIELPATLRVNAMIYAESIPFF
ncbi:MAG: hypothetical protein KBF32_13355, partial [Chitinophagales bacterium]|nr:hypothetical protein [Chitinophagales bacterium]